MIPRISTETPRYEMVGQIRRHLPTPAAVTLGHGPSAEEFAVLYTALSARDRAVVYRVALSLAEHAAEVVS